MRRGKARRRRIARAWKKAHREALTGEALDIARAWRQHMLKVLVESMDRRMMALVAPPPEPRP